MLQVTQVISSNEAWSERQDDPNFRPKQHGDALLPMPQKITMSLEIYREEKTDPCLEIVATKSTFAVFFQ